MAKSPRRRRSGGRAPRRSGKPPAAKPVKPVQPVQPPVAKPVPPVAPPAAKPVQPPVAKPAQPVRPAAAKPVAPAAKPVKPAAAKPAKPARAGRRAAEEEIGGGGGGGRAQRGGRAAGGGYAGSGGMGLGGKVGLMAGLAALVVGAAAALLSAGGGETGGEDGMLNEIGFRAAGQVAAIESSTWTGGPKTSNGFKKFKRTFIRLFGVQGEERWDILEQDVTDQSLLEDMDEQEKQEWQDRFNKFQETKKLIDKGTIGGGPKTAGGEVLLDRVRRVQRFDQESEAQVLGAWVTQGLLSWQPDWLAQSRGLQKNQLAVDPSQFKKAGRGAWGDGKLTMSGQTYDVRVFGVASEQTTPRVTGWVAVYKPASAGGGSSGKAGLGLGIAVLGAVVVGFVASSVAGAHTKDIRGLAGEIDRLGRSGDPSRQLRTSGAEASAVARAVERMVSHLEFREKHDGADMDEVVSREQKIAQEIHGSLMSKNPPRLSNYEVETLFKPGFEIGGDHFEYFRIDDNHLGVVLLDTNVRGVPAALVISQAKAYVRAHAPAQLSPAEVLKQVNRSLAGQLPGGRHVTALYAVIDLQAGKATMASAGHLPLIVYRHSSGKVFKVNPEGIALGLDKGPVFDSSLEEGDIPIGVGDRIVLYTDGALMIQNEIGDEFGEQRFYQAVSREAPKNSQAFVNFVGSAIDQFHLNSPQNDDITISTVKRLK
ncbi:MAG: PP2C family protein-serine/threonine phosphatase [Planctomycetota bacterium]|nr:PP2C family protein-serine/threonine phosphatase [Planctomycetota bacterium]